MLANEKTFSILKKPYCILSYALFVTLIYFYIDRPLASFFHDHQIRTMLFPINYITLLGKWIIYVALFLFGALYFRWLDTNKTYEFRCWFLFLSVLVANLVCLILKIIFGRARPDMLFMYQEFGFYGFSLNKNYWSFPSGHTTTVISVAVGIGTLFPRYFVWAISIALLIAATRVLLYFHYLSDVLTAFYLTLIVLAYLHTFVKKFNWINNKI